MPKPRDSAGAPADPAARPDRQVLLDVEDLVVEYGVDEPVRAVDHVSLRVRRGEFVGIVGESGCGKSTLLYAIARLLSPPARIVSGTVDFNGHHMVELTEDELRHIRWRDYSVVMQSAMNALNPVLSIGAQLRDAIAAHEKVSAATMRTRAEEVLRLVGIDPIHLSSYPHQLSGGMRQRAMIAMALVFRPDLVIMDEPTSALDVVAQRSLMRRVKQLQEEFGFAVLFVTHDMSLVSHYSDRLAIMYAGQLVELGPTSEVFAQARHPYSVGLLQAFPSLRGPRRELTGIPGSPPDLRHPPAGCRFQARCPQVMDVCRQEPATYQVGRAELVRCHLYAPSRRTPEPVEPR
ncbi:oligopeptide/dipeptide ABC transporter ATP-binding protein [Actinopolymorpha pittospori]|uniref:Peptide/nickel transport system ATP-binding protein n=1 Tax=Actinopolymorpha pittospori TaxID=648752 RepID=A0A927RBI4_9ACTN|nr:peptide/nickel transport system ATP-binding protein [Actinopolymorpha pittospori]